MTVFLLEVACTLLKGNTHCEWVFCMTNLEKRRQY